MGGTSTCQHSYTFETHSQLIHNPSVQNHFCLDCQKHLKQLSYQGCFHCSVCDRRSCYECQSSKGNPQANSDIGCAKCLKTIEQQVFQLPCRHSLCRNCISQNPQQCIVCGQQFYILDEAVEQTLKIKEQEEEEGGMVGNLIQALFGQFKDKIEKKIKKKIKKKIVKKIIKKIIKKAITRGILKSSAKKIPFVSIGAGVWGGIAKAWEGRWTQAVLQVGSGVAGMIPGGGTAASIAIDMVSLKYEVQNDLSDPEQILKKGLKIFFKKNKKLKKAMQRIQAVQRVKNRMK